MPSRRRNSKRKSTRKTQATAKTQAGRQRQVKEGRYHETRRGGLKKGQLKTRRDGRVVSKKKSNNVLNGSSVLRDFNAHVYGKKRDGSYKHNVGTKFSIELSEDKHGNRVVGTYVIRKKKMENGRVFRYAKTVAKRTMKKSKRAKSPRAKEISALRKAAERGDFQYILRRAKRAKSPRRATSKRRSSRRRLSGGAKKKACARKAPKCKSPKTRRGATTKCGRKRCILPASAKKSSPKRRKTTKKKKSPKKKKTSHKKKKTSSQRKKKVEDMVWDNFPSINRDGTIEMAPYLREKTDGDDQPQKRLVDIAEQLNVRVTGFDTHEELVDRITFKKMLNEVRRKLSPADSKYLEKEAAKYNMEFNTYTQAEMDAANVDLSMQYAYDPYDNL